MSDSRLTEIRFPGLRISAGQQFCTPETSPERPDVWYHWHHIIAVTDDKSGLAESVEYRGEPLDRATLATMLRRLADRLNGVDSR